MLSLIFIKIWIEGGENTTKTEGTIIGEMCKCGHTKYRHLAQKHGSIFVPGHGACTECDCEKFTWVGFVTA